jgi:hypothetical protein
MFRRDTPQLVWWVSFLNVNLGELSIFSNPSVHGNQIDDTAGSSYIHSYDGWRSKVKMVQNTVSLRNIVCAGERVHGYSISTYHFLELFRSGLTNLHGG